MEQEAKHIWSRAAASPGGNQQQEESKDRNHHLQAQGVHLQIEGLRGQATRKSVKAADSKARQHRILLERYTSSTSNSAHIIVIESSDSDAFSSSSGHDDPHPKHFLWETWLNHAKGSNGEWKQEHGFWIPIDPHTM